MAIELTAPTGVRKRLPAFGSVPQIIDLISWESVARNPVQLELLLYPTWVGQGLSPPAATGFPAGLFWSMEWSHGAPQRQGAGNSQTHQTPLLFGLTSTGGIPLPFSIIPANGLKLRLAATWLRIRVVSILAVATDIIASLQPVNDASPGSIIPPVNFPLALAVGSPAIAHPIGAREWRVVPSDPTMQIDQLYPDQTVRRSDLGGALQDWQVIDLAVQFWRVLAADFALNKQATAVYR